jgi:DNA-directed RNA polymerase specialized sigma24 family protein
VAFAGLGDEKAIHGLFALHKTRVYSLSLRVLGDVPKAEALTQQIFLNTFRHLNELRDDEAFSARLNGNLWGAVIRLRSRRGAKNVRLPD